MNIQDLLNNHRRVCDEAREIMESKNHDYTANNADALANFKASLTVGVEPELGLLVRMMDKFKRIETFVKYNTLKVKNEPVDDAIRDCINYIILLHGLLQERKQNAQTQEIIKESAQVNLGEIKTTI